MTLHQLLLESKEIRRLIVQRSEKYNIPLRYVCREAGIEYNRFIAGYINAQSSRAEDFSEAKLLKVLEALGVSIRFQVVIDGAIDMKEVLRTLEEKYSRK